MALTGCPPWMEVTRTKPKKASVQIGLSLSTAGSVTISGRGLKSTTRRDISAGGQSITVPLTRAGVALHRAGRRLAASVRLSAAGATVAATASFR